MVALALDYHELHLELLLHYQDEIIKNKSHLKLKQTNSHSLSISLTHAKDACKDSVLL